MTNKPLWYRILWNWGWRPRLFRILEEITGSFQHPFSPVGFVTWSNYDGDFHLCIGDRDIVVDWRGKFVASGTGVGDGKDWVTTTRKTMPRSQWHHYAHTDQGEIE